MWLRLAEGLLPGYDQPQPSKATTNQPAATSADVLALAGVRAWAEYEANTDADDAVICPPTRTLLALLEDLCRDAVLALPFGDQTQGRVAIQVTVEHGEDQEDQPTTALPRALPPALSKPFFRCAPTARAICTGPLANLELPTVERLAEAIAATINQRTNTPPELQHAQWLTDTMTVAGVEMYLHHTKPTLLRVGDDNLCAISLGKEGEEFADTLRLAVALTSPIALLRAIRLRTIVIYLTESEFDPSELVIHPFSQTIREAGELGGNIAQAEDEEELELNYEENDNAMEDATAFKRKIERFVDSPNDVDGRSFWPIIKMVRMHSSNRKVPSCCCEFLSSPGSGSLSRTHVIVLGRGVKGL
eukprot:jgi/Tetstr1/439277/TSEL_027719.t1